MPVIGATSRYDAADLDDAREALEYWETRAAALPRLAVRERREAREMAVRSRAWVTEAERAVYGRGVQGALLLMASEMRLPEPTRHAGRQVARRARQAAVLVVVAVLTVLLATTIAVVALIAALLGAF
jgi:hypothetical protein